MKPMRTILLSVFLTIAVCTSVTYMACNKNHCKNVTCLNNGQCDGGNCICLVGFEGDRCQTLSRNKFINTYNGHDSCGSFNGHTYEQYPLRIVTKIGDSVEMTMIGLLNNLDDSAICTIERPDSFYFQGFNNSTTYYGGALLRNDSLFLNYHVQHDTTSYDCRWFGIGLH